MTASATVQPDRGYWTLWGVAAGVLVVSGYAAAATGVVGQMPHVWLFTTVAFTWLTLNWTEETPLPRPSPHLGATVAAMAALAGTTSLLMEADLGDTLRTMVGVPAQAFVTAWLYRTGRRLTDSPPHPVLDGVGAWRNTWVRTWVPTSAVDLALLGVAALASGVVGLVVGAAPGLYWGNVDGGVAAQWLTHAFVVASVGGATTLISFGTWSPADVDQPWGRILLVWVVSVAVLWWVYATGAVNMAWLAVLPAIFVALSYRMWVTSTFGLLVGLVSILLSPALNTFPAAGGPVPLRSVMDLLVSTLILVSLLVAQLNQRRMQLLADLAAEQADARRQAEVLQNVFETMRDGVVLVDRELNVRMHNGASVTLLGRGFPPERPRSWTDHFHLTRLDGTPLTEDELITSSHLTLRIAGTPRVLRQTAARITEDPETRWMIFFTDVTEHQARLQELSGFAGVVAHDLRAPLSSLEGWLEMAEESLSARDPEEASALLARARASNWRMRQVIEDWLAYTVEREGALELTNLPLAEPVALVLAQAQEAGPHEAVVEAPHVVRVDAGLVRQLFANLIGNAKKFVRPGQTPCIEVVSHPDADGMVRVDVVDHGIGLPVGEEERIFDDYHRAPGEALDREGFGMGLAACRRIVQRHGGVISARTNEHGGATFTFTLPAAEAAGAANGDEADDADGVLTASS